MSAAPQLSVLWESVDPEEALSQRFGFADAVSAVGWMGDTLWDTWAIPVDDCDRLVISGGKLLAWITADDRRVIAKWSVDSKLFQRLADTTTLTMWLHHRGVPVAAPIPARDGRLRAELDNASLGVIPVIDGGLLDVGDPAQVTEAGRMLATIHDAMAAYPRHIGGGPSARHEQLVHNDGATGPRLPNGPRGAVGGIEVGCCHDPESGPHLISGNVFKTATPVNRKSGKAPGQKCLQKSRSQRTTWPHGSRTRM